MADNNHSQDRTRNRWTIPVWVVVLSSLLMSCGGTTQTKTYTIGVVNLAPSFDAVIIESFKEGLAELGYVEGENVTYIYEGPAGVDKLDAVAQGLVEADVDLILSLTTPATKAAQRATADTDIPVVFIPVTDPVGAGIVDSLRNPGGNITGVTFSASEAARLRWLLQVAPTIEQIYVFYNPEDQSPVLALEAADAAAAELGIEMITREVRSPEEVTTAMENIPEQADAIFFLPDSLVSTRMLDLIEAAVELGLPTSGANTGIVEYGLLTAYGMDLKSYLLPTCQACSLTRYQVAAISCKRCQPRQITVMPGSPSPLRPRKPPSLAIQRTACRTVGGDSGNAVVL